MTTFHPGGLDSAAQIGLFTIARPTAAVRLCAGGAMRIAVTAIMSATAAAVATALFGDPLFGIVAFCIVVAVSIAARFATLRGLLSATFLFMIPPGVVGESAASLSLIGAVGLVGVVFSYPREISVAGIGLRTVAVLAMAGPAAGLALLGQWPFVATYVILAGAGVLACTRPAFFSGLVRGLASFFAFYVVSYLLTMAIGFRGRMITTIDVGHRTLELYAPATLATSGAPIFEGTRRGAPLIGEPGLVVFYLLPLIAALFLVSSNRVRLGLFILITSAVAVTQSTATILVVSAVLLIGLTLTRIRRRSLGTVLLVLASAAVAVPAFILPVFDQKNSVAGVSIAARGIGAEGGHQNINILVAMTNNPALAACLIAGLIFAMCVAIRTIAGFVIWLAFAITAVTAQPSQWQVGAWFVVVAIALHLATARGWKPNAEVRRGRRDGRVRETV